MSPNLEKHIFKRNHARGGDISLTLAPITETNALDEENNPFAEVTQHEYIPDITIPIDVNYIPLEHNLRELLVRSHLFQIKYQFNHEE